MLNDLILLTLPEIEERLKTLPPGWEYANDKIYKTFEFASFMDVIYFINQLAPFCEHIDHHPDIHILYKKIKLELQRFSVGGKVTERDFTVAKEIEELYSKFPKLKT